MKYIILFLFISSISIASFAQPFLRGQRAPGGNSDDAFARMCLTSDSGFIAGGSSMSDSSGSKSQDSKGDYDMWIIKYNSAGKQKWDRTIGGSLSDELYDIKATADGGYILAGASSSNRSGDKTENCRGYQDN